MTGQEAAYERAEETWETYTLLQKVAEYDPENEKELILELLEFWEKRVQSSMSLGPHSYTHASENLGRLQGCIRSWINDTYKETFIQLAMEDAESDLTDRVYDEQGDR